MARNGLTEFEDALECICETYVEEDKKGNLETWEETDEFIRKKAKILLEYAKKELEK